MTSFAFCGFLDVHFSLNGLCVCLSLAFPIFPIDVIQKSASDVYIYTLMLTSSYAGYTYYETIVPLVSDKKGVQPTHACLMIMVWLLPGEVRAKLGKTAETIRRLGRYWASVFAFRFSRMTSFAFCSFLHVHFSSNGLCGCWSLAFSIFPIDVIQKSTSDTLIYTLMLTISHAGYAIRKTVVLTVGEPGYLVGLSCARASTVLGLAMRR